MAYLGSTPTTQSFIAGTDTFSGTGAQVAFTLTRAVNSVNDILVVVNNVDQQPSAYSVSGTTLTFTAAPSSGTNNVYVRYLSTTLQSISVGQGSVSPASLTTGGPYWDVNGNVGIDGATPSAWGSGYSVVEFDKGVFCGRQEQNNNAVIGANLYHDGTNWRHKQTAASGFVAINQLGNFIFLNAPSAAAGAVPAFVTQFQVNAAGNLLFNSGYGSAAVAYGCRAWVNFNGTGTVAIRASGNVSSITDNGTGDYTANFATAMPDANYSMVGTTNFNTGVGEIFNVGNYNGTSNTATTCRIRTKVYGLAVTDNEVNNIAIFR